MGIWDRFTVGFSEDMAAETVNDVANLDLRAAGPDGVFDTDDDAVYALSSTAYTAGLSTQYYISDGPLQAGSYRLTMGTGLTDRARTRWWKPMCVSSPWKMCRGFILENRDNRNQPSATSLSLAPSDTPSGTFAWRETPGVGSNPYYVASGLLNDDASLDLVTADYNSNTISVLLGNGNGTFQSRVTYPTGSNPIALTLGDFDGDGDQDLAVANYSSNTVSILSGNGDGTFASSGTLAVGSRPLSRDHNGCKRRRPAGPGVRQLQQR